MKVVAPEPEPAPAPVKKRKRCPKCNKKMVFTAIMQLRDRNGISARKITKFVAREFNVTPKQVRRVIKKQIAKGRLSVQTRSMGGGLLVLEERKVVVKPKKVVADPNPMKTRSGKCLAAQKVVKKAKRIATTSKVTVKVCVPVKQYKTRSRPFTRSCLNK